MVTSRYIPYEEFNIIDDCHKRHNRFTPVLASTNVGDDSQSGVNISITVPEGNVATFSWKGMATGLYPNQAMIYLNGDPVNKSLDGSEKSNEHDLSDKIILKSGTYDMTFIYSIILDWYTMGGCRNKAPGLFLRLRPYTLSCTGKRN